MSPMKRDCLSLTGTHAESAGVLSGIVERMSTSSAPVAPDGLTENVASLR
jgi:hypothetical protein